MNPSNIPTTPRKARSPLIAYSDCDVIDGVMRLELPFPPASLSGHNKGHWRGKSSVVSDHRDLAKITTAQGVLDFAVPAEGDIQISIFFYPPDRRGDRINFPNRMKPYFDGIADALGVNDSRFLPSYHFADPGKPGFVMVEVFGR